MPLIVDNRPTQPLPEGATSQRTPFAPVILRVPDLNRQAAPVAGAASNGARVWKFRTRLPSATSFLKGLTSRVLLAAIAMSAIAIFYMALNGTSPAPKPAPAPNNNIPLISSVPNGSKKPPSATVLLGETKPNNGGLFQDLPRPSATTLHSDSNSPAAVSPDPPTNNVQPIRSVPATDQGPVLLSPSGDQAAMRGATLSDAARREVFSWSQAEFNGGIDKAPLARPAVPTPGNLR